MEAVKEAPRRQLSTMGHVSTNTGERPSGYFNTTKDRPAVCMYDVLFHQQSGYDAHLHRDDRRHFKSRGLNVHAEETARDVPVLSSSEYGRQVKAIADPSDRQFARVGIVRSEFYRLNGASLQHTGWAKTEPHLPPQRWLPAATAAVTSFIKTREL